MIHLTPHMHTPTNTNRYRRNGGTNGGRHGLVTTLLNTHNLLLLSLLVTSNFNRVQIIKINKRTPVQLLRRQGLANVKVNSFANLLTSNKQLRRTYKQQFNHNLHNLHLIHTNKLGRYYNTLNKKVVLARYKHNDRQLISSINGQLGVATNNATSRQHLIQRIRHVNVRHRHNVHGGNHSVVNTTHPRYRLRRALHTFTLVKRHNRHLFSNKVFRRATRTIQTR